ncbi:MAG: hypothetical protein V4722_18640 [Bacteroidota bacterium]
MKQLQLLIFALAACKLQAQNVGINYSNPQFPLSFNGALGDKISLWTDGTPTHYGFGIQSSTLQIFAKTSLDDVAFGYGSSSNFIETMRVKGSGNVGIATTAPSAKLSVGTGGIELAGGAMSTLLRTNAGGLGTAANNELSLASIGFKAGGNNSALGIRAFRNAAGNDWIATSLLIGYDVDNSVRAAGAGSGFLALSAQGNIGIGIANPQEKLDVAGRMQLNGSSPFDAGVWLNNAGVKRAFIGLKDNNYVGFYSAGGAGWAGFTVNTASGALSLNGNEGQPGQLLSSNGGAVAGWTNRPYVTYYNEAGATSLSGSALCADIGGVNGQVLSLTQDAYITYQFNTTLYASNGSFGGASIGAVSIQFLNGASQVVSGATSQYSLQNFTATTILATGIGILPAGNYTIRARLVRGTTNDGVTQTNFGAIGTQANCNDVPIINGQMMVQVFPK